MRFNSTWPVLAIAAGAAATMAAPEASQARGARAAASTVAIVSSGQLVFDGGPFHGSPVAITGVIGDWYATKDDGHASLTIKGSAAGQHITLDLQWDGAERQHAITKANNSDMGGRHVSFLLRFGPSAGEQALARPDGDDAVTVMVDRADDHDLQARVSGAASSDTKTGASATSIHLSGGLSLHRDNVARLKSGEYRSCDPVIYDKLVGTESRSPSACEAKFDADVRAALQKAFDPIVHALEAEDWIVARRPNMDPIDAIARHTETQPYRMDLTRNGAFGLQLRLNPAGEVVRGYQQRQQVLMNQLGKEPNEALVTQIAAIANERQANTVIAIGVSANLPNGAAFTSYKGPLETLTVPGAVYAVWAPALPASTGGGAGSAHPGARILLGRFGAPAARTQSDGSIAVRAPNQWTSNAPPLSIQTMEIRIDSGRALVDQVLRRMDLDALGALLR